MNRSRGLACHHWPIDVFAPRPSMISTLKGVRSRLLCAHDVPFGPRGRPHGMASCTALSSVADSMHITHTAALPRRHARSESSRASLALGPSLAFTRRCHSSMIVRPGGCSTSWRAGRTILLCRGAARPFCPSYLSSTHHCTRTVTPVSPLVQDRKSTRLNSSHSGESRMPSSA